MAKKYAIQTYKRTSDGTLKATLIDAKTGEVVSAKSAKDYDIVTSTDYDSMTLTGQLPGTGTDTGNTDNKTPSAPKNPRTYGGRTNAERGSNSSTNKNSTTSSKRDFSNNFGYKHKPGWVGATSLALPGVLGTLAKVANLGWDLNNKEAKKSLTSIFGEDKTKKSFGQKVKDFVLGPDGSITTDIGGKTQKVSVDPTDMGSLTPMEGIHRKEGFAKLANPEKYSVPASTNQAFARLHPEIDPGTKKNKTSNPLGVGGFGNISNFNRTGLDPSIASVLDAMSPDFGDIEVTSGFRDPKKNAEVGGVKDSQHIQGKAVDLSFAGMTDDQKQRALDKALATGSIGGVGISIDRDGIHLDTRPGAKTTWGYLGGTNVHAAPKDLPAWAAPVVADWQQNDVYNPKFGAPTPTPRPETVAQGIIDQAKTPTGIGIKASGIALSTPGAAKTYAELSAQGKVTRSPQEKEAIAHTLAGELDPSTLEGLAAGDPMAQREFANMVTTVENRIGKLGDISGVLTPSQYNSLEPSNIANTDAHFAKYSSALMGNLDGYYAGTVKPTDYGLTSYYNPNLVTPSWTNNSFMQTGFHAFGTTPDWVAIPEQSVNMASTVPFSDYAKSFYNDAAKMSSLAADTLKDTSNKLGNSFASGMSSGFKSFSSNGANRPATGPGNAPTGGNSYSNYSGLGGKNSPTEGTNRFGGFGLGTPGTTTSGNNFGRADTPSSGRSIGGFNSGKTSSPSNPSQMGGTGMSSGLGNSNKDKDKSKSQGPSGGGYGGWGGPH